ncbi:MAG: hypothetical protein A3I61_12315 [Acidobacteria bacterium RIFCSPLOWO2_02_FULL_68_18]|nr:MAG: hypothetical protein A3I61_12315 [Acidobacteria bacterium RIFCSPLOWO2_02_FULL_68_18]OFW50827.1 MAG: hypothetical protein A3G77_16705 [Acidobacteria bacterium RIFCSPLOWO2_12_FULL_68_19]
MSSSSRATLRFVSRAVSSRLAFVADETRHVYTSVLLGMHYSVVHVGTADPSAAGAPLRTSATGIACGDETASLTGETFDGQPIAELVQSHGADDGVRDPMRVERLHELGERFLDLGLSHEEPLGGVNAEPETLLGGISEAGRTRHSGTTALGRAVKVATGRSRAARTA